MKTTTKVMIISLFLWSFTTFALPVSFGSVSNGAKCTKSGTKTSVGKKTYICGKNPYFKPSKLTWTLRECLNANRLLREAKEQYEVGQSISKLAGPEAMDILSELQNSISELEKTMKEDVCKRGR